MRVHEGTELQHKHYPWYQLKLMEKVRGGWKAAELHLGEPWNRKEEYVTCILPSRELRHYEYLGR